MNILRTFVASLLLCSLGYFPEKEASAQGQLSSVDHAVQGGQIGGVFDSCGQGGQAGVLVYIPGRSFDARTGPGGGFVLSYVPAGLWTLVFERQGNVIHTVEDVFVGMRAATDLGLVSVCSDQDGDGFDLSQDCDDLNPAVNPDAPELCNGIDDNCDGVVDEGCVSCSDADSDGFFAQTSCGTAVDCDDANPAVNPDALEACFDSIDNNCDGEADEGCTQCDVGAPCETGQVGLCAIGVFDQSCSCVLVNPAEPEICDSRDNDCDGQVDEDSVCTP